MNKSWGSRRASLDFARAALGLFSLGSALLCVPAFGQIVPDTTLGTESSRVNPNVNIRGLPGDRIDGGAVRGTSLFHSFKDFNVNNGQRVYFADPAGIANIFSRVTGSNVSNILGKLGVDGAANLFLLNPNGFIFGLNAQLDIQGSFLATTANRFVFPNGIEFGTTNPQAPPLLSMSVPVGVQYGAQPGNIANSGTLTVGQDLMLAGGNLDLQGQLVAGRDLTLQAQDTVWVRDSALTPFIASAGGKLVVQGNQKVDIFALNHPNSGFFSGGDMVLRSANTVGGDAHYWAGGTFRIEKLDGSPGNLFSPRDPIVLSGGDVSLGDYTGGSLHILAGGSVTLNDVTITGTDPNTIHPGNTTPFNSTQTIASLASFTLADGTPITIQGDTTPTLDVRSGVNWAALGGFPVPDPTAITAVIPSPVTTPASDASITVNGTITNTQPNGLVLLTNQFQPNTVAGNIAVRDMSTTSTSLGNGGSIIIDSRGDFIPSGNLDSSATGTGQGGDIRIQAVGDVRLDGISFKSSSNSSGIGDGGNIVVGARSLSLTNGARLTTSTSGQGNAGDVVVNAQGAVTLAGVSSSNSPSKISSEVEQGAVGQGGNISIASNSLSLTNGAQLITNSFGQGKAGDVRINAQGAVNLTGVSSSNSPSLITSSLQPGAVGQGGNIAIASGSLSLADGALLTTSASGQGNAGNISIQTSGAVSLLNSRLFSRLETNGIGNAGFVEIQAGSLSLTDGAQLSTSNFGQGNAGDIRINAQGAVTLAGVSSSNSPSKISSEVEQGAVAQRGNISIASSSLSLTNGAQLSTSNFGQGNAGNISIQTSGAVSLVNGGIFSRVESSGLNNAGSITINAGSVSLTNGAQVGISGSSQGQAGSITINARRITLDNAGGVTTKTASGQGGNINLTIGEKLLLNNGSEISTQSGSQSPPRSGDGGVITINAKDGLVIAVPSENSDILASSYGDQGGTVNINALQVVGLRSQQRITPDQLKALRANGISDTNASFDPNLESQLEDNTQDTEPSQELAELTTTTLRSPSNLIARGCGSTGGTTANPQSEFVVTGRGGLPPGPDDPQTSGAMPPGWVSRDVGKVSRVAEPIEPPSTPPTDTLVEAQGMFMNANGEMVLTAQTPTATPHQSGFPAKLCPPVSDSR